MRTVYTTGQVAKILRVAPRTVCKWFDAGKLKGYRIPGSKDRRIPRDALIRFMKDNGFAEAEIARLTPQQPEEQNAPTPAPE